MGARKKVFAFILIITILNLFFKDSLFAAENNQNKISLFLDQKTVDKGYTLQSLDKNLLIGVWGGVLEKPTWTEVKKIGKENLTPLEDKDIISDLYIFDFKERKFDDFKKPYTLLLKYKSENESYKAIYFYNPLLNKWSEVRPFYIDKKNKFIRVNLKFPYAQVAVLEEKVEIGYASWYKHGTGLYAAHPTYPKGTRLKVTNLNNNKSVVVLVNDYGPDRTIYPERIIDLNSVSFKRIAYLSQGIVKVKVERL